MGIKINDLKTIMEKVSVQSLINCIITINNNNNNNKINERSNLRKFHNWIKSILIIKVKEFYEKNNDNKVISLLDIAVGRGGDLLKWEKAGIKNVVGIDNSIDSIYSTDNENPGAIARLKKIKLNVKVNYFVGDVTDKSLKIKGNIKQFDFVSCQFALHYFFKSEESIRNVLSLISKSLKKGGYFYGTTVDGEKIKELLKNKHIIDKSTYKIEKKYKSGNGYFGKEYNFLIKDTLYFDTFGGSNEYLVNFDILNKIALEYSLYPVYTEFFNHFYLGSSNITDFDELYHIYIKEYNKQQLSSEEFEISKLNSVFVFIKK